MFREIKKAELFVLEKVKSRAREENLAEHLSSTLLIEGEVKLPTKDAREIIVSTRKEGSPRRNFRRKSDDTNKAV